MVLNSRLRISGKWVEVNLHRKANSRTDHVVVAALAAEAEVAESVDELEGAESSDGSITTGTVTVPKPKKGKAALPLKRDRV